MLDDVWGAISVPLSSITIITTYQCTAACRDCCFECHPGLHARLSESTILSYISEAVDTFPELKVVVFSGGEPLLMGRTLFNSIEHAHRLERCTRIVTNGYWGKSSVSAKKTAHRLKQAGLDEINISTGLDHAEFVPLESVVNACVALAEVGIPNRVTIETDNPDTNFRQQLIAHPVIRAITAESPHLLSFQVNTWMPFHTTSTLRPAPLMSTIDTPCQQLFSNLTLTPHGQISACCGLTLEHIRELRLGIYEPGCLRSLFDSQLEDMLKLWIAVDGPVSIIRRVMGDRAEPLTRDLRHICQACTILHHDPEIRKELSSSYVKYAPEVLTKFLARAAIKQAHEGTINSESGKTA